MRLKNQLRVIRTEHDLTQQELARLVEVSRQTIISIEKGNYEPSVKLALRIAQVFNCPVEDIFLLSSR